MDTSSFKKSATDMFNRSGLRHPKQWFGTGKLIDISWDRPVRALLSLAFLLWAFSYAAGWLTWGAASLVVGWKPLSV